MQFSQAELHIPHPQVQLGEEMCCSELMLTVTHACTHTHTQSLCRSLSTRGVLSLAHNCYRSVTGAQSEYIITQGQLSNLLMLSEAITNKNLLNNNHQCFPITLLWEGEDD